MRLIDADKLIEDMRNLAKRQISNCPNIAEFFVSIRVDRIIDILNSQPTAFDVEKVARQIEDLKEENFKRGVKENEPALLYASSCLHKALEIIKAGGIDE